MNETLEAPLRDHERAQLFAFVDEPVPAGFADRVVTAWTQERAASTPIESPSPAAEPSVLLLRRRSMRIAVAAIVSLAAVLLVAWFSRTALIERNEARERMARLAAREAEVPAALARMRLDAHALLAAHCVPCHDSTASTADAAALDVFDVQDPSWWLAMSDRQLRIVVDRVSSSADMGADEIAGIERYVQAELDFRAGGPT